MEFQDYEMLRKQADCLRMLLRQHKDIEERIVRSLRELDSASSRMEKLGFIYRENCKECRREIEERLCQLEAENMECVYASPDFMRSLISELKA